MSGFWLPRITGIAAEIGQPDLVRAGALEVCDLQPCNLSNEIYCGFRQDKFPTLAPELYQRLVPALRLATALLFNVHSSRWFIKLALGNRQIDPTSGRSYLTDVPLTPENRQQMALRLGKASQYIQIDFQHPSGTYQSAITNFKQNEAGERIVHIKLNAEFAYYLQNVKPTSPPGLRLRVLFLIAVTMVHELAHAVHILRFPLPQEEFKAFYFNLEDPEAEIGYSWEHHMFQRIMSGTDIDDLHDKWTPVPYWGLFSGSWAEKCLPNSTNNTGEAVSTAWINQFYRTEFWSQHSSSGSGAAIPPQSQAGALFIEGDWVSYRSLQAVSGVPNSAPEPSNDNIIETQNQLSEEMSMTLNEEDDVSIYLNF